MIDIDDELNPLVNTIIIDIFNKLDLMMTKELKFEQFLSFSEKLNQDLTQQ